MDPIFAFCKVNKLYSLRNKIDLFGSVLLASHPSAVVTRILTPPPYAHRSELVCDWLKFIWACENITPPIFAYLLGVRSFEGGGGGKSKGNGVYYKGRRGGFKRKDFFIVILF